MQRVRALPQPDATFELQLDDVVVGYVESMGGGYIPRKLDLCAVLGCHLPGEGFRDVADAWSEIETTMDDDVCHEAPSPGFVPKLAFQTCTTSRTCVCGLDQGLELLGRQSK